MGTKESEQKFRSEQTQTRGVSEQRQGDQTETKEMGTQSSYLMASSLQNSTSCRGNFD